VHYTAIIKKFANQGEKTGWTYIEVPSLQAQKLKPGNKTTFRVKGNLDNYSLRQVAILPMGNGDFILPVNAEIRKGIKKQKGEEVIVDLQVDESEIKPPSDFVECLADEPNAENYFNSLTKGHQRYFINWINTAKTTTTKEKRIAEAINALSKNMDFGQMLRVLKQINKERK
jgi:hypothetical protein